MRGKVEQVECVRQDPGITPAYAGKRTIRKNVPIISKDHPRVCGEKSCSFIIKPINMGSPPRMRGKVSDLAIAGAKAGITPAYAGKS